LGSIMGGDIVIVEGSRTGMRNSAVDIPIPRVGGCQHRCSR
jgi:hypothetical protein